MDEVTRRGFIGTGAAGLSALAVGRVPRWPRGAEDLPSGGWDIVTDFGAKGDGVTDDADAVQRAVDAAAARPAGGVAFFPPGAYRLSRGISIRANGVTLVGSGRQASMLVAGGKLSSLVRVGAVDRGVYRWGVRDLGLSDPQGVAEVALDLGYAREGGCEDVWLHRGFTDAALLLRGDSDQGCWTNRFTRLAVSNTAGDGAVLGPQSNAVFFSQCHFTSCAGTHLRILQGQGVKLLACQFEQSEGGTEITIGESAVPVRALGVSVAHCYFELKAKTPAARALRVRGGPAAHNVRALSFSDNYVWGGGAEYAVEVDAPRSVVTGRLADNALFGVTQAGVRLIGGPQVHMAVTGEGALTGFGTGTAAPLVGGS